MKTSILILTLFLTGCVSGVGHLVDIRVISKQPIPSYAGYVWAKYDVVCNDVHNTVYRVDFYGPDFKVDDAMRQREYRLGCKDVADSDDWEDVDDDEDSK